MAFDPFALFRIRSEDDTRQGIQSAQRGFKGLIGTVSKLNFSLGGVAAGAGVVGLVLAADRTAVLSQRLKSATKDTDDFALRWRELGGIARATGSQLESNVATFQALSRTRTDIGATNDQMIAFTRTVQSLGVIGGSTTEGLKNGLRQLQQALAGGTVRAEEFNSLLENLPELAQRIANGLEKSVGQLKLMVNEGELASRAVFKTILEQTAEIARELDAIPISLERALSGFGTTLTQIVSSGNEAVGFTRTIAAGVDTLSKGLAVATGQADELERNALALTLTELDLLKAKTNLAVASTVTGTSFKIFAKTILGVDDPLKNLTQSVKNYEARLEELRSQRDVLITVDTTLAPGAVRQSPAEKRASERQDRNREKLLQGAVRTTELLRQQALRAQDDQLGLEQRQFQAQVKVLEDKRDALLAAGVNEITARTEHNINVELLQEGHVARVRKINEEAAQQSAKEKAAREKRQSEILEENRSTIQALERQSLEQANSQNAIALLERDEKLAELENNRQLLIEEGLITAEIQAEIDEAKLVAEEIFQSRLAEIREKAAAQIRKEKDKETKENEKRDRLQRQRDKFLVEDGLDLLAIFATRSKTAAKALVALEAVKSLRSIYIWTQAAAMRAMAEIPYPANFVVAGTVIGLGASAAAVVASNATLDGGGGGGLGGGFGGGGASTSAPQAELPDIPEFTAEDRNRIEQGEAGGFVVRSDGSDQLVDTIVDLLNEASRQGKVIIQPDSENAAAIRTTEDGD